MIFKYRVLFSWLLVFIWMGSIFYLSGMSSDSSNSKSKESISVVVESSIHVTNDLGIINEPISKSNINSIVNVLNKPLRKCMHSFMYFILVILLLNAFKSMCIFNITSVYLYSVAVSIFYAFTDEFHQLFITGRTGQLMDVGIDMIGVLFGVLVFYIYGLLVKDRRLCINS